MRLSTAFAVVSCALAAGALADYFGVKDVTEQFMKFARKDQTKEDVDIFDKMVKLLSTPSFIYRTALEDYSQARQSVICLLCRAAFATAIQLRQLGASEEFITEIFIDLCILLELQNGRVCKGVIELNAPLILYIIDHEPAATPDSFCGLYFQGSSSEECPLNDERFEFSINIPEQTGNVANHMSKNQQLKIVHLSDAHIDPQYEPNGVADCNDPTCCRYGQKPGEGYRYSVISNDESVARSILIRDSEVVLDLNYADEVSTNRDMSRRRWMSEETRNVDDQPAGYWGDYRNCDTPIWAFKDIVEHAAENHYDADFVYYTGDTVDHGVWETTHKLCEESIKGATEKIANAFPNALIYHVLGNHESQPVNQFAPVQVTKANLTTKWLYNLVADQWSKWLPEDAQETVKRGGYYTVVPKPGFRIIALNTNVAYRSNWWLVFNPKDPDGQLQWFSDTLYEAEMNREIVHILSHIPSGTRDMYKTWSREYRRIYHRFSNIIAAEFNGHTHTDEIKIFYSKNDPSVATNIAWNGAAMTTYSSYNVNYKVLSVDSSTYEPLDIDTWIYNLTLANETPLKRPNWYKLYSFKEAYGLNSLKPQQIHNLVRRMATLKDRHLLHKYVRYYGKEGDLYLSNNCDKKCELKHLCSMVTTELWDNEKCDEIQSIYESENSIGIS